MSQNIRLKKIEKPCNSGGAFLLLKCIQTEACVENQLVNQNKNLEKLCHSGGALLLSKCIQTEACVENQLMNQNKIYYEQDDIKILFCILCNSFWAFIISITFI